MADRGEIRSGARTALLTAALGVSFGVLRTEIAADYRSRTRVADRVHARCLEAPEKGG